MRLLICLALVLSGCGVVQKVRDIGTEPVPDLPVLPERVARPNFVAFEIETVLVGMDDGTQCRGTAGAALGSAGWSGVLSECPYPYPYAVELAAGTTAERAYLEEVAADIVVEEGDVPFRPLVQVIITDTEGRRFRFQSITGF
jgi:hypothetical protein